MTTCASSQPAPVLLQPMVTVSSPATPLLPTRPVPTAVNLNQNLVNTDFITPVATTMTNKRKWREAPNEEFTRITRARSVRLSAKPDYLNTAPSSTARSNIKNQSITTPNTTAGSSSILEVSTGEISQPRAGSKRTSNAARK
jgi:hypothetical protein